MRTLLLLLLFGIAVRAQTPDSAAFMPKCESTFEYSSCFPCRDQRPLRESNSWGESKDVLPTNTTNTTDFAAALFESCDFVSPHLTPENCSAVDAEWGAAYRPRTNSSFARQMADVPFCSVRQLPNSTSQARCEAVGQALSVTYSGVMAVGTASSLAAKPAIVRASTPVVDEWALTKPLMTAPSGRLAWGVYRETICMRIYSSEYFGNRCCADKFGHDQGWGSTS